MAENYNSAYTGIQIDQSVGAVLAKEDAWDGAAEKTETIDNTPTANSDNLVTSGGVKTALDLKADTAAVNAALDLKAPLASPALTGTPKAPTATAGTNTTQIATTAFVKTAAGNAVSAAIEDADAKLALKADAAALATFVRPNLLDNWYFVGGGSQLGDGVFPINQRGQTTYTNSGDCIDRWTGANNASRVDVLTDGLKISVTADTDYNTRIFTTILQNYSDLAGKTVTFSVLVTGTSGSHFMAGVRALATGDTVWLDTVNITGTGLFTKTTTLQDNLKALRVVINTSTSAPSGAWVKIAAVKLELGNTQTLAHNTGTAASPVWVLNELPNWKTEMLKANANNDTSGVTVDLIASGHTSSGNAYICPGDGYLWINCAAGDTGYAFIQGSKQTNAYLQAGGAQGRYTTFVKAGMKLYVNGTVSTARFVQLT